MSFVKLVKTSSLVFATTAILASQVAVAKDNIMLGYADPEDSIFGKAVTAFSEKLTEVSGGKMSVTHSQMEFWVVLTKCLLCYNKDHVMQLLLLHHL